MSREHGDLASLKTDARSLKRTHQTAEPTCFPLIIMSALHLVKETRHEKLKGDGRRKGSGGKDVVVIVRNCGKSG